MGVKRGGVSELLDLARVHHRDAVRYTHRFFLIVGDEDAGDAPVAQQRLQLDLHRFAQLAVQRGKRLVQQQKVGAHHKRARHRDALLLATRQPRDRPVGKVLHPHQRQRLGHGRGRVTLAHPACAQAEGHVLRDRQMREQRIVLEHDRDVALVRRQRGYIAPRKDHRPVVRRHQPRDDAQKRGLATPGRAQERDKLAPGHAKVHPVHHRHALERFPDGDNVQIALVQRGGDGALRRDGGSLWHQSAISVSNRSVHARRFSDTNCQSGA